MFASLVAVTDPSTSLLVVIELSAIFPVVTAPRAMRGLGYTPVRSPPAGPVAVEPCTSTWVALVTRPCASIVKTPILVAEPYVPCVTPVFASFCDVIAPSCTLEVTMALSAISSVAIDPSRIFADVTASEAIRGAGYVPVRSPPAVPVGDAPVMVTFDAVVMRPCASTEKTPTCDDEP